MHVIKLLSTTFELVFQNHPIRTLYTLDTVFQSEHFIHWMQCSDKMKKTNIILSGQFPNPISKSQEEVKSIPLTHQ